MAQGLETFADALNDSSKVQFLSSPKITLQLVAFDGRTALVYKPTISRGHIPTVYTATQAS